jgi:hypothetical protein
LIREEKLLFLITEEVTGVTREEIVSKSRKPHIVDARRMIALSFFKNTKFTLSKIGGFVGGVDHSSVSYYIKKHDGLMETDYNFRKNFSAINTKFKIYQEGGIPIEIKLEFALEERARATKEVSRLRKLINIKNKQLCA